MPGKPSEVLDDIVSTYRLERDLLKVASRAVRSADASHLARTTFIGRQVDESQAHIERLRSRLDEMTVVSLWISFERFVLAHVESQVRVAATNPPSLGENIETHVAHHIERSRFNEILDLYKGWVDADTLGDRKNINDYRDWISHRNPKRAVPAAVERGVARRVLGRVMDAIA